MRRRAFTLVEILIVVVILGILAAVIVPMMMRATDDSAQAVTRSELQKLRNHLGVYWAREGRFPDVQAGSGTWGQIVGSASEYLHSAPINAWVGSANGRVIVLGNAPDGGYQTTHGWIFDPATGSVWAGAFDANDEPFPRAP